VRTYKSNFAKTKRRKYVRSLKKQKVTMRKKLYRKHDIIQLIPKNFSFNPHVEKAEDFSTIVTHSKLFEISCIGSAQSKLIRRSFL